VRSIPPSVPPVIAAILPDLARDLLATLGDDLVAVWLYGSAITGGFDPESSDLDLVVVTATDVAAIDLGRLDGVVQRLAIREPDWADRLDLAFVGRSTLAAFRSGGAVASISHDDPLQLYDEADQWLQTWYLGRETGVSVFGPAPAELIPSISRAEFVAAVARGALELADHAATDERDGWRAYTLLTLCRVLVTTETSGIIPKQEAAVAALRGHPELHRAIEAALAFRDARGRVPIDAAARPAVLAAIEVLAREVRSKAGSPLGPKVS
jgi:hypothetical protein